VGNSPEVIYNLNSYAEKVDSCTITDVPINKCHFSKITIERARKDRPFFIAPETNNEFQTALGGKTLEKVVSFAH
jgi:hypothetical protein